MEDMENMENMESMENTEAKLKNENLYGGIEWWSFDTSLYAQAIMGKTRALLGNI